MRQLDDDLQTQHMVIIGDRPTIEAGKMTLADMGLFDEKRTAVAFKASKDGAVHIPAIAVQYRVYRDPSNSEKYPWVLIHSPSLTRRWSLECARGVDRPCRDRCPPGPARESPG